MIKEALELLRDEWTNRRNPVEIPNQRPDVRTYLVAENGAWSDLTVSLPDPPLAVQVTSAESLIAGLEEYQEAVCKGGNGKRTVCFVSPTSVVAVLRECEDRLDRLTLRLTKTPALLKLSALRHPGQRMSQAELLTLLRIELFGLVDAAVIGKYRVLDWSQTSGVRAEKTQRTETLGRSVEARVQAVDDLPEFLPIVVQVWEETPWITRTIQMFIDPEPMQGTFRVAVPAQALDVAVSSAVDELVSWLRSQTENDAYTVLAGTPE